MHEPVWLQGALQSVVDVPTVIHQRIRDLTEFKSIAGERSPRPPHGCARARPEPETSLEITSGHASAEPCFPPILGKLGIFFPSVSSARGDLQYGLLRRRTCDLRDWSRIPLSVAPHPCVIRQDPYGQRFPLRGGMARMHAVRRYVCADYRLCFKTDSCVEFATLQLATLWLAYGS